MTKKMTVEQAESLIADARTEAVELSHSYGFIRLDGRIKGCAICALYIGCGGAILDRGPNSPFVGDPETMREFLEAGLTAPPIKKRDLIDLECGYEDFKNGICGEIVTPNPHSVFYKLGVKLRKEVGHKV
jgi:hypothetical protein